MSRGAGAIENRIADLIAATRDSGLSVAELTDVTSTTGGSDSHPRATPVGDPCGASPHPADERGQRKGLACSTRHTGKLSRLGPRPLPLGSFRR
jgi:hypothetical protein